VARRLDRFPEERDREARRYPWDEWTDGSAWEIRRGGDYDVDTENMRVNLHLKAEARGMKVRTKKVRDENGEGLVFQFYDPDGEEADNLLATADKTELDQLYDDLMDIYERARAEVTIPRSDGRRQRYAAVRFKQQIERARKNGELVPAVARIVRKPTLGFGHLEAAGRPDLMVETLVIDGSKPYHRLFTAKTVAAARQRMQERGY
jgi:hypothetical protein